MSFILKIRRHLFIKDKIISRPNDYSNMLKKSVLISNFINHVFIFVTVGHTEYQSFKGK